MKFQEIYQKEVIPKMREKFGYRNSLSVPKIKKIVVNTGFGKMVVASGSEEKKKNIDFILEELAKITGQRPVIIKAKKSVAGFKLRKGMPSGAQVTLRRGRMYDFLAKVIHIVLPRLRDFRGINVNSVDDKGNLTLGMKENINFPEASSENAKSNFGLEMTIVTTAKSKEEGMEFLKILGVPLKM